MDRIRSDHEISASLGRTEVIVRLDGQLALRTLVLGVLLLWPLILFGRPGYIADSAAYIKGGKVAVEFVADRWEPVSPQVIAPAGPTAGSNDLGSPRAEAAGAKGVRSIPYSVLAYLFRGPGFSLTWLAGVQILLAAFTCAVVATAAGVRSWKRYAVLSLFWQQGLRFRPSRHSPCPTSSPGLSRLARFSLPFVRELSPADLPDACGDREPGGRRARQHCAVGFWLCVAGRVRALAASSPDATYQSSRVALGPDGHRRCGDGRRRLRRLR